MEQLLNMQEQLVYPRTVPENCMYGYPKCKQYYFEALEDA